MVYCGFSPGVRRVAQGLLDWLHPQESLYLLSQMYCSTNMCQQLGWKILILFKGKGSLHLQK